MTQQASETKHPTDEELIARAKQVIEGNDKPTVILSRDEAAAMLRACKGRVPTRRRLAQIIQGESGHADGWALARADDVLAALEPVPDHAEWNAALEAAAKKCETHGVLGGPVENPYAEWKAHADNLAAVIRALKKGQTND